MMRMRRLRERHELGQELVEFAMVIPVVIVVFMAIFEFGLMMFSFHTISSAAREGARYGSVFPTDEVGIEEAARGLTSGLAEDSLSVSITTPASAGDPIRVDVNYDHPLVSGMFLDALGVSDPIFPMHAASTMQVE